MPRTALVTLAGSLLLGVSPFLPWLRLGAVGIPGIPDPAGFFVLGTAVVGALLAGAGGVRRREFPQFLFLVGLAGGTTLGLVWTSGAATIAERALTHAQAVALVDNVAIQVPPPVTIGPGLYIGLAGAILISGAALFRIAAPHR